MEHRFKADRSHARVDERTLHSYGKPGHIFIRFPLESGWVMYKLLADPEKSYAYMIDAKGIGDVVEVGMGRAPLLSRTENESLRPACWRSITASSRGKTTTRNHRPALLRRSQRSLRSRRVLLADACRKRYRSLGGTAGLTANIQRMRPLESQEAGVQL